MKTRFTPGPWNIKPVVDEDHNFLFQVIHAAGLEVANTAGGDFEDFEEAANARLIAAAPRMFQLLVEYLTGGPDVGHNLGLAHDTIDLLGSIEGES